MERTVGNLGMSVGTSLAFEGEGIRSLRTVDNVHVNLRTVIRNAIEAFDKVVPDTKQAYEASKQDLIKIAEVIEKNRDNKPILFKVYYPSYKSLESKFKHALLKKPKTSKQVARHTLVEGVLKLFKKNNASLLELVDSTPPRFNGKAFIITHHAVDLVLSPSPTRLLLLESHTGYVKPYTLWNTKLTDGNNLHNIPLNKLTIQIFGDKSTDFFSHSSKVKDLVKSIATKRNWTTGTSFEKIKTDIRSLPQSVDKAALLLMC